MLKSNTLHIHEKDGLCYITFPNIERLGFVKHAFSTRLGGVSKGCFSSMNLSFSRGDDKAAVLENYKIFCKAIGVDYRRCVLSRQVHELNVRVVTEADIGKGILRHRDYESVDALVTNLPEVPLVTQYADCVPLLFCDPVHKAIGAAHASWRCTLGEIGRLTVEKMAEHYGTDPADLVVGIAPSICGKCFEVDRPVVDAFEGLKAADIHDFCRQKGEKYYIDLQGFNRQLLIRLGVKPENITVTDLCTKCRPDYFFSHRVTGPARGNLAALLCISE